MKTAWLNRYERWRTDTYPRLAPTLVVVTLVIASFASIGVLWLTKVQNDEQDRRASAINGLLGCFDTYASRSAATSKAVRDASEDVSEAQAGEARAAVVEALVDVEWTNLLVAGLAYEGEETSPESVEIVTNFVAKTRELQEAKEGQARAEAALVRAQENLAQVRADNPVPDAPSSFCEVQP